MKATSFRYSNYPLRIAQSESNKKENLAQIRLLLKTDVRNLRFSIIENSRIQDPSNWDASWFSNYE